MRSSVFSMKKALPKKDGAAAGLRAAVILEVLGREIACVCKA